TLPADALARALATHLAPAAFEFRQLLTQRVDLDPLCAVVCLIEGAENCALLIEIEFREPSRNLLLVKFTVRPCDRFYSCKLLIQSFIDIAIAMQFICTA